jgi:hypothetical protein
VHEVFSYVMCSDFCIKFHMHGCNDSLLIAIRLKDIESSHAVTLLLYYIL